MMNGFGQRFQDGSYFLWLGKLKNTMNNVMSCFMFKKTHDLEYSHQQQVISNYLEMYFSLVVINWCRKNTLAYAMQQALEQMDSFIRAKTQDQNHPMTRYLLLFHSQYNQEISKRIHSNLHKEQTLDTPFETREDCSALAAQYFQKSKSQLSSLHQKLTEKQKSANSFKTILGGLIKKIRCFAWKQQEASL